MQIKGNEEANKAAKEAIDVLGVTKTGLPFTNYCLTRRVRNSEWENSSSKLHQIKHCLQL